MKHNITTLILFIYYIAGILIYSKKIFDVQILIF